MIPYIRHILFVVLIALLSALPKFSKACTCIGKENQSTQNELQFVDVAVKGRVISMSDYVYYDTATYSLLGTKLDPSQSGYLIRRFKLFKFVVDTKFKSATNLPDTLYVITGQGGGDCGYEFEVGKEYIVYGDVWKEKTVAVQQRKQKTKRRIVETIKEATYYTDICRLTQESNSKELDNLRKLTE